MAATDFQWWDKQFIVPDVSGNLRFAAGYSLYQYASGTTTNQTTWTDTAGTIANPNPIVLNAIGSPPNPVYGTPGLSYTFTLKDLAGAVVSTWNDALPASVATSGTFVSKAGDTMTGLLYLSGPATSALGAVTKAQMDSADALTLASATDAATAATTAAAAATAAAANVLPWFFEFWSATGAAVTQSWNLAAGTYQVGMQTFAWRDDGSGTYTCNVTQSGSVGTTSLSTAFTLDKFGGTGYGRKVYGDAPSIGTLTVSTTGSITFTMAAVVLNGATGSRGTRIWAMRLT